MKYFLKGVIIGLLKCCIFNLVISVFSLIALGSYFVMSIHNKFVLVCSLLVLPGIALIYAALSLAVVNEIYIAIDKLENK